MSQSAEAELRILLKTGACGAKIRQILAERQVQLLRLKLNLILMNKIAHALRCAEFYFFIFSSGSTASFGLYHQTKNQENFFTSGKNKAILMCEGKKINGKSILK